MTEFDIIKQLVEIDRLFIEDIGTTVSNDRPESDFSLRTFLVILDKRLECCRATFITTNKSIEQLGESFDLRIASRLQQACVVIRLTGQDKRGPA
jgi:DNA replication protein DnaC